MGSWQLQQHLIKVAARGEAKPNPFTPHHKYKSNVDSLLFSITANSQNF